MESSRVSSRPESSGARRYRTIVADPPWPIQDFPEWADRKGAIATPYSTMTLDEIRALPVYEMSDNLDSDAHLYLWTINAYLRESFDLARAWGFWPTRTIVWCKAPMGTGLGGVWPSNVEFVLFCRRPKVTSRPDVLRVTERLLQHAEERGITRRQVDEHLGTSDMAGWWLSRIETRCAIPTDDQWPKLKAFLGLGDDLDADVARINAAKGKTERQKLSRAPSSWFEWRRGEHSAKPEAFLDLVEQVSPGPYLELFARRDRLGWDTWGDESLGTAEMVA